MKKKTKQSVIWMLFFLGLLALAFYISKPVELISPIPKGYTLVIIKEVYAKEKQGDPIVDEISRVFKNEGTKTVAKAIMCFYGESKLNPLAYNFNRNKTADIGIAQINDVHGMSVEERQDYKKNIKKAYELFKKYGWKPWYSPSCKQ